MKNLPIQLTSGDMEPRKLERRMQDSDAPELPQASIAAEYLFYRTPTVDKAWCP